MAEILPDSPTGRRLAACYEAEQAVIGAAREWVAARRWDPSGEGVEEAERGLESAVFALGKLESNRP